MEHLISPAPFPLVTKQLAENAQKRTKTKVVKPLDHNLLILEREVSSPVACAVCQTIALYVEKWLAENTTEQAIIDRLDVFCNELPGVGAECQAIVSIYLPDLIKWIENKETPLVFCTQVDLCSSEKDLLYDNPKIDASLEQQDTQKRDVSQVSKCEVCEVIVTYVEQLVAANNTIAVIVSKVEQLCNLLPAPASGICDTIAAKYVPQLVKWILSKENPQTFCSHIGFCT
jgi:saposin